MGAAEAGGEGVARTDGDVETAEMRQ